MTVYVAVWEWDCETSSVCGVYSTKKKAMEARAERDEITIYEVQVDANPLDYGDTLKEIKP